MDDAPELATLHGRCFEQGWTALDLARMTSAMPYTGLAAREGEMLAGFVAVSIAADEAEILTLAVDPAFRRRGIAAAMLARLAEDLAGLGVAAIFLEVREDNRAAQASYLADGYAEIAVRRNYYRTAGGAVSALVMKRQLHP